MHWPKSSNMTKTCYHHMLFVRGVGFYSKITFLTPISRSKVICRSKSCDMLGQGQWSFPPSLVKIGQVMTELQHDWQKKKERKKEFYKDRTRRHVCRLVKKKRVRNKILRLRRQDKEETSKIQDPAGVSGRVMMKFEHQQHSLELAVSCNQTVFNNHRMHLSPDILGFTYFTFMIPKL